MSKRILSLIAVLVLLTTALAVTLASSEIVGGFYPVYSRCGNGRPLNIRSGPGKEYSVIGSVPYGDMIYVVGETFPGWLQTTSGGFVQANLTSTKYPGQYVPPAPTPTPDPSNPDNGKDELNSIFASARFVEPYMITLKATQKSKGVANVRWAPTKSSRLQKAYPEGTQVRVIAELDKWYQIEDPTTSMVGFVNTAYVEK